MTATARARSVPATARRWPDLLLVGAAHAGTTHLRAALDRHPDVCFSDPPEPHFFSRIRPSRRFAREIPVITDEAAYLALFSATPPGAIAAEGSTSYLWSAEAPGRIAAANPAATIVIVLRDPIERAWAHHRADQAAGVERRGFLRSIRDELARPGRWGHDQVYLGAGFYADAIDRYRRSFAPDQLWIGFYESLIADTRSTAREVMAWLGRDPIGWQPRRRSSRWSRAVPGERHSAADQGWTRPSSPPWTSRSGVCWPRSTRMTSPG